MSSPTLTLESPCNPPSTKIEKSWPFVEYYVGERDKEQRKNGNGTNHWSGAESLEWYTGRLLRDTMHGIGEYRCRHRDEPNVDVTYEGYFYNNYMHGYGVTSYPDGNVFTGLFHSNIRWGPGVKTEARLREDVGLWKGTQLVRLTWRPTTPSVVPDLMSTSVGCDIVAQHRSLLIVKRKTIGETNPALELLKQYGADPLTAAQNWTKLYPKNCTDGKSQLFYAENFDRAYYDSNEIVSLEDYKPEPSFKPENKKANQKSTAILNDKPLLETFYAWNNNKIIIHMMKHCYQHEKQRKSTQLNLDKVLNGPRQLFRPAGAHELDCRELLMSSYLGDIYQVTNLINEYGVNPNVTDMQGNSAVMYAACGNEPVILHFLVEAGAQINYYNDSCCTPLGVVLINYACAHLDIQPCDIIKAILPLTIDTVLSQENMMEKTSEWKIQRNWVEMVSVSKKDASDPLRKSAGESISKKNDRNETQSLNQAKSVITNESENSIYKNLFNVFKIRVDDLFSVSNATTPVKYIFEVNDMVESINALTIEVEPKKETKDKKEPKKTVSKIQAVKKSTLDLVTSAQIRPEDLIKDELLKSMMSTITQLLSDGADPRLVRCPQPALFFAVVSQNVELIEMLVKHGADVNEVYHGSLGYTPLDIAVSASLTYQSLDVIRTLLKVGARPDHRIPINDPSINEEGPTLLHAVLAKEQNGDEDEEILLQLLEILLAHGCDPLAQYMGQSSMHIALSKSADTFDVFIENPNTDLNGIINKSNQTLLVKMFQLAYCRTITIAERVLKLTHILLFGADPLLKCQNEQNEYDNLFVYAKTVLSELEKTTTAKTPSASAPVAGVKKSNTDIKGKKSKNAIAKPTGSKTVNPSKGISGDEIGDYKQGLSQVTNCARLLFIRWIQAEFLKELITLVDRFKYRHWNMILKEYKNGKRMGLWLNPVRCLEIWDILETTNKRIYKDKTIKKHVLCIVVFHFKKTKKILRWAVSAEDKASIESEVAYFVREHNLVSKVQDYKRPYVTPELTPSNEIEKFNICFECALPLVEGNIRCYKCKLVSFCSLDCMKINIERYSCHPCSVFLKAKYFPVTDSSEIEVEVTNV